MAGGVGTSRQVKKRVFSEEDPLLFWDRSSVRQVGGWCEVDGWKGLESAGYPVRISG